MKRIKQQLSSVSPVTIGMVLLFAAIMTFVLIQSFAAVGPASLYTSPSGTKSVDKGSTFTVNIRIDTASNVPITGASVYVSYPGSKLKVQQVSYNNSPYNLKIVQSNSGGVLRMDRGALPAIPGGDKLFAKVTFKAIANGSAAIGFTDNSYVTSGEDDSDLPLQKSAVSYNISTSSSDESSSSPPKKSSTRSLDDNTDIQSTQTSGSSAQESSSSLDSNNQNTSSNSEKKTTNDKATESGNDEETKILEIVVVDEQQNPVEGAEVTIDGSTAKTDKNGIARFEKIPAGDQDIIITYNGDKTFQTVHVKGASTENNPESLTVSINRDAKNPIILLAIPLFGLLAIAGFLFCKPSLVNQLKNMLKRGGTSDGQSHFRANQSELDAPLTDHQNTVPSGGSISPEPTTPTENLNDNPTQNDND
jgi:hypothetical protein